MKTVYNFLSNASWFYSIYVLFPVIHPSKNKPLKILSNYTMTPYSVIGIVVDYLTVLINTSSVGIATDYGLDGSGIESRWGRDFPLLSIPALGPTQPPVQWVPGLSQG
jgi:hypothetical protein